LAWWGLRWLPDDEGLVLLAMGRTSAIDTDLLLFDLREGRDPGPRNLTDADPYSVWQFLLSPDGSQLVYGSERPMSAALHRMRLPELGGR
jgi:Tol biopolymer transport system component